MLKLEDGDECSPTPNVKYHHCTVTPSEIPGRREVGVQISIISSYRDTGMQVPPDFDRKSVGVQAHDMVEFEKYQKIRKLESRIRSEIKLRSKYDYQILDFAERIQILEDNLDQVKAVNFQLTEETKVLHKKISEYHFDEVMNKVAADTVEESEYIELEAGTGTVDEVIQCVASGEESMEW